MSCPNACRTRRLLLVVHQASPATWPTWVTYPRSPTPDTCCPLPRPFTLHSVTLTTLIARLSGPNLTEATPGPELPACRTQRVAINTINGPLQCIESRADLLRHVQRLERRGFHLDLKVTSCLTSMTGRTREGLQQTQWRANVTKALFVPSVTDGGKKGMNRDASPFCFAYFY